MHGFAIAERIEQVSKDVLRVEAGSLYPALHRMTEAGWVKSSWGVSENNRRARFYTITAVGRRRLADEEAHWSALTSAVGRVLKTRLIAMSRPVALRQPVSTASGRPRARRRAARFTSRC